MWSRVVQALQKTASKEAGRNGSFRVAGDAPRGTYFPDTLSMSWLMSSPTAPARPVDRRGRSPCRSRGRAPGGPGRDVRHHLRVPVVLAHEHRGDHRAVPRRECPVELDLGLRIRRIHREDSGKSTARAGSFRPRLEHRRSMSFLGSPPRTLDGGGTQSLFKNVGANWALNGLQILVLLKLAPFVVEALGRAQRPVSHDVSIGDPLAPRPRRADGPCASSPSTSRGRTSSARCGRRDLPGISSARPRALAIGAALCGPSGRLPARRGRRGLPPGIEGARIAFAVVVVRSRWGSRWLPYGVFRAPRFRRATRSAASPPASR